MVESLKAIKYIDGDSFAAPRGQCTVELLAGRESAMLRAGDPHRAGARQYVLSFSVGDASNACRVAARSWWRPTRAGSPTKVWRTRLFVQTHACTRYRAMPARKRVHDMLNGKSYS
jgi:hypothetical protein